MTDTLFYLDIFGFILAGAVFFCIAVYVYFQNRSSIINISYAMMTFFLFLWAMGGLSRRIINNLDYIVMAHRGTYALAAVAIMYILYFNLVFPKNRDLPLWVKLLIAIPPGCLVVLLLFTDLLVKGFQPIGEKYLSIGSVIRGPWYDYFIGYSALYTFGSIAIILCKMFRSSGRERRLLYLIAGSFIFGSISAQFLNLWLPLVGLPYFESLSRVVLIPSFILIVYAIVTTRIFSITPEAVVEEILISLQDLILVSDLKGAVLYGNKKMGLTEAEIIELVDGTVAQGFLSGHKTLIRGKLYSVSSRFVKDGGAVVMIFHDITEVEREEAAARKIHDELMNRLETEKRERDILGRLAIVRSDDKIEQTLDLAMTALADVPRSTAVVEKMAELTRQRFRLLDQIKADKSALEARLLEISKANKESVQRELKMVELKEKIAELKEAKGSQ